ncbi:hypothetical protein K2Q08_01290 [Patescibacteria group bacterium]|nr:hypothetical protein [Patescibacteria group bacterium]
MNKLVNRALMALVAVLMAITVAYAQQQAQQVASSGQQPQVAATQSPILGAWYGSIGGGYPSSEPRRNLTISFVEGSARCVWEEPGKKPDFLDCVADGAKVSFKTGPGSIVDMDLGPTGLKGSFTPKNNKSYPIEMGRTPVSYQAARKTLGPPVKCGAKGWRDGGTAYLIIEMLDPTKGTVKITGLSTDGRPWGGGSINRQWTYKDGVLDFVHQQRYRIHLVVGDRNLKGSFHDYNAPSASLSQIDYVCDGPLDRVTVR